jgi:hypothetical protein
VSGKKRRDYRWQDKHPVVDMLRTLFQIEAAIRGLSMWGMIRIVSKSTGVSEGCYKNWFTGPTCNPRFGYVQDTVAHFGVPLFVDGREVDRHWSKVYRDKKHRGRLRVVARKTAA